MPGTVLITGAASGIGRATADAFVKAGWFVGAYDIDAATVAGWVADVGAASACGGALDIADIEQWRAVIADFEHRAGGLDVLVNNAGTGVAGSFAELDMAAQKQVIDVNVTGTMNGCHAAKPALTVSGGRIINLSSASAFFGQPAMAVYSASKFAVRGLTEALSVEWADSGVSVCDIMPMFVDTPMAEVIAELPAVRRLGIRLTPEQVATVIVQAAHARRPKLHYVVGAQNRLFKYFTRLSPDWLVRRATIRIAMH